MQEFKGTPGPWVYRSKNDSVCTPGKDGYQFGNQVFRFHGEWEEDLPSDDDLNLVLAAPDLLGALTAVTALAEGLDDQIEYERGRCRDWETREKDGDIPEPIKAARRAIAKALGHV